jgi:hypothetical protein
MNGCQYAATVTIKDGVQFKNLCELHGQIELFDLILNSAHVTFRTFNNYPLPPVIEVDDRREQIL